MPSGFKIREKWGGWAVEEYTDGEWKEVRRFTEILTAAQYVDMRITGRNAQKEQSM